MKEQLFYNPSYNQAKHMAQFSGISLTEEQTMTYIEQREKMPSGQEEESKPWLKSDQELFDSILDPDQSIIFRKKYPNIFLS